MAQQSTRTMLAFPSPMAIKDAEGSFMPQNSVHALIEGKFLLEILRLLSLAPWFGSLFCHVDYCWL
jgi:hypothetical protein